MRFRRGAVVLASLVATLLASPPVAANHFYTSYGWRDKHVSWPARPAGYTAIVNTFGEPCNNKVNDNRTYWTAQDDGVAYAVYYHDKLGGYGKFYGGTGSTTRSSNFNNDVRGHIRNEHYGSYITHGIWGYSCRKIANSTKWSTHAWGIAVDINSAANPYPTSTCNGMPKGLIKKWTDHYWVHGKAFSDCMHFQFAKDY